MTLYDLRGKEMYVGTQKVKRILQGINSLFEFPGVYAGPYAYKQDGGMLYAYDFTQGLTEPYSTPNPGSYISGPIFSGTPVYTGTSMSLSGGYRYLKHDVNAAVSNTTSYYFSITFDTASAVVGKIFNIDVGGGYNRIIKVVSGGNTTFRLIVQNGLGITYVDSPIITTPQTTIDVYNANNYPAKFWVNGAPLQDVNRGTSMNGSSSDFMIYGAINIYDYKVYLNPGVTPFTNDIILEQYQNIQQRLQTI